MYTLHSNKPKSNKLFKVKYTDILAVAKITAKL